MNGMSDLQLTVFEDSGGFTVVFDGDFGEAFGQVMAE